ncbi:HNH endonuclease, partial [Acinetobacter baumannii]
NTVALCPNCHKKMHVVNAEADREKLKIINSQLNTTYSFQ